MKRTLKYLQIFLFSLMAISTSAQQGDVGISVQSFPSPYFADWTVDPNLSRIVANFNFSQPTEVVFKVSLIHFAMNATYSVQSFPILVQAGPQQIIIDNVQFLDFGTKQVTRNFEERLQRSGRFPSGLYDLCVEVLNEYDGAILAQSCGGFEITVPAPPYLIMPQNEQEVCNSDIVLQWTPVDWTHTPVLYKVKLVEQYANQPAQEAFAINPAKFQTDVLDITSVLYPPSAVPLDSNRTYCWGVQANDINGVPLGENSGLSEIWTFDYCKPDSSIIRNPRLIPIPIEKIPPDTPPTTFERFCYVQTKVLPGVKMNGGIDLGPKAKKTGEQMVLSFIFQEDDPIPLKGVGKDYDLLMFDCLPDPHCPETPSKRYENLTGRVRYEWSIVEGPGEFNECTCVDGSKSATGDYVFLDVEIPSDTNRTTVKAILRIVDDLAGQVLDAPVIRMVEIEAMRMDSTIDSVKYTIKADPITLPSPKVLTDVIGLCKALPPVWDGVDDIRAPMIISNSAHIGKAIIPGEIVTLNASDVRDGDVVKLGCISKRCTGQNAAPSFPDGIQYKWSLTFDGEDDLSDGRSNVGFIVGIDPEKGVYDLRKTVIGSQVLLHVERPETDFGVDGKIIVDVLAYNDGGGQIGDKPKGSKAEYEIIQGPIPSVFLTEVFEPEEEGVQPGIINYDLYEWNTPGSVIEELPTDITLEVDGARLDGNMNFDAPINSDIVTYYKAQDRENEDQFNFNLPDDGGTMMISGLGSVNNLNCLCSGTTLFEANSLVRFPVDVMQLEEYTSKLEDNCHSKKGSREKRKEILGNLEKQRAEIKKFNGDLIKRNDTLKSENNKKIKDWEEAIEELASEEQRLKKEISDAAAYLSQNNNPVFELRRLQNALVIDEENLIKLKEERKKALSDVGLKEDATRKEIERKIKSLKSLERSNLKGSTRKARKLRLEYATKAWKKAIKDSEDNAKPPKEMNKILEATYKEMEAARAALKELDDALKEIQRKIRALKRVLKNFDSVEKMEKKVAATKAQIKKLTEIYNKRHDWSARRLAAELDLTRIPKLKRAAEEQLKSTRKFAAEIEEKKKEYEDIDARLDALVPRLHTIAKSLVPEANYGEMSKWYREKKSTKALKNALETMVYLSSDEYLSFSSGDGAKIIQSFVCGYLSGLNPMETIEMIQFVSYLAILRATNEDAYNDEVDKIMKVVAGAAEAFKKAKLADQVAILAQVIGNMKGEIHLAKAAKLAGTPVAKKLADANDLAKLEQAMKKANAEMKLPDWPPANKNSVIGRLFYRHKVIDAEMWKLKHASFEKRIDDIVAGKVDGKKMKKEAADLLKSVIEPSDLYYLNQTDLAEPALRRVLDKIQLKYDQKIKSGALKADYEPIYWQAFYAFRDINPTMAKMMDQTRDKIIQRHVDIVKNMPELKGMEFEVMVGYTGSAKKISDDWVPPKGKKKPDVKGDAKDQELWKLIAGDRDLLFLGKDAPVAMARFKQSMRRDLGNGWGQILDCDAYMDSQFDSPDLILKKLNPQKQALAKKVLESHRAEMNKLTRKRLEDYKSGKSDSPKDKDLTPEEKNILADRMLFDIGYHYKRWLKHGRMIDLAEYLRLNREYFLSQKDAYLTIGGRKIEVAYRSKWSDDYGLKNGDDWTRYIIEVPSGKLDDFEGMILATKQEGLENITDNLVQVYNKSRKIPGQEMLIAHETAKYYERAIRTSCQVKKRFSPRDIKLHGKSAEDYRQLAMKIKEGKEMESTKAMIYRFYNGSDIDLTNTNLAKELEELGARFTKELGEATELVRVRINSLPD